MGWLWSSGSTDDSGVKKTEGGAFESPSRSNRKQCYAARDAFFECLDKNQILDSINSKAGREKAASFCGQFDQEFEKNCAHSWVRDISVVCPKCGVMWLTDRAPGRVLQKAESCQLPTRTDNQEDRVSGRRNYCTAITPPGPEVGLFQMLSNATHDHV
jgi:hypothetical protein